MINPTPYPEVNSLLRELLTGVQSVLGDQLIGMYLDGSLASGDNDEESDIDFIAAKWVQETLGEPRAALIERAWVRWQSG